MGLINFILNLAGLWLWLNWLSIRLDSPAQAAGPSLAGTLKRTGAIGPGRWVYLAGLLALLLLRGWVYQQTGGMLHWTPKLNLGVFPLPFPKARLVHMLLFSGFSFGSALAAFYLGILLLSVTNRQVPDTDPFQKLVRVLFKPLESWPAVLKLVLPLLLVALLWVAAYPLLERLAIVPAAKSFPQLLEQAGLVGLSAYLAWKYLIVTVLLLHVLHSHVHLGGHPVWKYVDITAHNLLAPLGWLPLRVGRLDLLPLAGAALVWFAGEFVANPTAWLPALRPWYYRLMPF